MTNEELFDKVLDENWEISQEKLEDLINYLTALYNVRFLKVMGDKLPPVKDELL